jgi:alpha-amylase
VFGLHLHQPVGNFDDVIARHVRDVYRPFLERAAAAGFLPLTLHVSGPLLEWLEQHDRTFLDTIGGLAADGRVELLLAGFDEPILAALPRADRLEQIGRMREFLRARFGVTARGLWLTERVWEPGLAAELADAQVAYTLVDDRHFLVSGFEREALHRPYRTEANGQTVGVLAIDERLRYLIPFRAPEETAAYLRDLRAAGQPLAVLADDGEKFGGWPGTREWVYERGWLDAFLRVMLAMKDAGELALVRGADAVDRVPGGGLAYLGTASYREMEKWALPPAAQRAFEELEERHPGSPFVRGGHWPHFLVKYPESNRMHKTMVALSALARRRGDPPTARRALGRAQCNDAYWHGVFGGLYLPHLRHAVWHQLALAERELRRDEAPACEALDLDGDGYEELWVHGARFSAIVSPRRGGAIETLLLLDEGVNLADTLTRRREPYHEAALARAAAAESGGDHTPSIHDIERQATLRDLPPADRDTRALIVERVIRADVAEGDYGQARYTPLRSWSGSAMEAAAATTADAVTLTLRAPGFEKTLRFAAEGCLDVAYHWDPGAWPEHAVFAPELSLRREPGGALRFDPVPEVWRSPIATVARSERGFEETVQGVAITPRWPAALGRASLSLGRSGG